MTPGDYAALILVSGAVLLALIGAVVYGIHADYTATLTVGLKPKPAPKVITASGTEGTS